MPTILTDADDPRLAPLADLQNRADDGFFVTEGRTATARLIASKYEVAAVVTDRDDDAITAGLDPAVPVYRLARTELSRLVGFRFHRGVLGLGRRVAPAEGSHLPVWTAPVGLRCNNDGRPAGFEVAALGLVGVSDPENVGSLLRTAACLGINDVLIDSSTVDPLARRVTRVSMAHNLSINLIRIVDLLTTIASLRDEGFDVLAATPGATATDIEKYRVGPPALLLLGNEGDGLPADVQNAATHRVRIAMPPGHDSLGVAAAGAILMHRLGRHRR